jgi:hypothetical protein
MANQGYKDVILELKKKGTNIQDASVASKILKLREQLKWVDTLAAFSGSGVL